VYVPDLTAYDVMNIREVEELIEQGRQNRHTFATNMNEHSSRSHSVLMVNIHGRNVLTGQVANGKLNLVDLAGSERISKSEAVGARLKEAQVRVVFAGWLPAMAGRRHLASQPERVTRLKHHRL
jgi:kinesin family protein C2/C3